MLLRARTFCIRWVVISLPVQSSWKQMRGRECPPSLVYASEPVGIFCKAHSAGDEVVYEFLRISYHTVNRGGVVFVVSRTHSIFKIALIVVLVHKAADSALGKVAVRLVGGILADNKNFSVPRQIERAVEPRNARAYDNYVVILIKFNHKRLFKVCADSALPVS